MDTQQAISELSLIRKRYLAQAESIDRKRSWRASEKAMAKASYHRSILALDKAVEALKVACHVA